MHKSFGIPDTPGLTSALLGDTALKDAVFETEVPNLFILPSGPIPPNPAELIHTERFQEVLQTLKGEFDKVILDSPPVGAVADALILSRYAGGVVLTLRFLKTTRDIAARSKRALLDVNARVLGVVLNDLDLDRRDGYYNYYQARYGYNYAYTYGEPEQEKGDVKAA